MPLKFLVPLDVPVRLPGSTAKKKGSTLLGIWGYRIQAAAVKFSIDSWSFGQEEARIKKKKDDESTLMREQHTWQMFFLGMDGGGGMVSWKRRE